MALRTRPLVILALLGMFGCEKSTVIPPTATLSGKVNYRGKPVTGGILLFITDTGHQVSTNIEADGTYSLKPFVGNSKIAINNKILMTEREKAAEKASAPRGGVSKAPEGPPPRLQSSLTDTKVIPGKYMPIPQKYESIDTSGLTYTVEAGDHTKDFNLE